MPLKADDLKTVENYKKAMKQEVTRITAAGNTKFWVYRDVELPTASGGKQKLPALLALVDDTAVKPLLKGKQPLCRGVCGIQEGKIAFAPAQGKVPYNLLKTSVPLLLGKMVHMPSGIDADADEEVPAAPPPPPPPAAPPPPAKSAGPGRYARLNADWKQYSQVANQRMSEDSAQNASLTEAMAGIPDMLRSGQLAEAEKRLEQLRVTLKIPAAPPPPPPAPPAPPEGGQPQGRYAQLNASWKQLSERAAQRIAANPASRAFLAQAMAGIPELLQSGKLPETQKRIEQLEAALKPPPPAPPPPPTAAGGPIHAQLSALWKRLSQQASERTVANPAERTALTEAMEGIPEMLKAGKLIDARKRLDQLEGTLKGAAATEKETRDRAAEWKRLEEQVNQAIARHPERKADLVRASAGVGEMIRVGKAQLAERLMNNLRALLADVEAKAETVEEKVRRQETAWKEMVGDVRAAIARFPNLELDLAKVLDAAEKARDAGKHEESDKLVDQVAERVSLLEDAKQRFDNWYDRVEGMVNDFVAEGSANAREVSLARDGMQAKYASDDYEGALGMLRRMVKLVPGAQAEAEGAGA